MRLIDADAFDASLVDAQERCKSGGGTFRYGVLSCVRGNLAKQPTVDVVPVKHGKWFDAMVGELPVQVCDQCSTFFPLAYTGGGHHYCPNCGAKMDLEDEQ